MAIFSGAASAIVTPFNKYGNVNFEKFDEILDYQINNGIDAIVVCGTTGETSVLSTEDHIDVVKYVTKYVNKRVPVIAGIGSNNTNYAMHMFEELDKVGIDAVLSVTPYYNKCTQNGLYEHYKAIASISSTPIIMYNVPNRTGINIQPETCAKIIKNIPSVVGIKEASGDISQVVKIMDYTDGNVEVYSGNDDQVVPILSLGGLGVVSVLANIVPNDVHTMCEAWFNGNIKKSLSIQLKYCRLIDILFCEVNPIPIKYALSLIGFEVGDVKLPLTHILHEHAELLVNEMKRVGILNDKSNN